MSGGSYNYLCYKEPEELLCKHNTDYLEEMCELLIKLGYDDVARDMQRLIEYCKTAYNRIDVLREQLKDVMHAIEWYESGDYGLDTLRKSIEKYRNS